MQGVYELTDASGRVIRITYVAIARVLPGLHLSCLLTGRSPESAGALSRRERDVVTLAAQGLTSNEIADTLSLSRATVETHFRNAVRRLSARNRAPRHRSRPNPRGDSPVRCQREGPNLAATGIRHQLVNQADGSPHPAPRRNRAPDLSSSR